MVATGERQEPSFRRLVACRWIPSPGWGQQVRPVLRQALSILRNGMLLHSRTCPDFLRELEVLSATLSAVCPGFLTTSRAGLQISILQPICPASCCPSRRLWPRGHIKTLIPNGGIPREDKFRIVIFTVSMSGLMRFWVTSKTERKLPCFSSAAGSNRPRFLFREDH